MAAKTEEVDEDSDNSFERMSNDDLNTDDAQILKKSLPNNYVFTDKDGLKWTNLYANEESTW